MLDQLKRDPRTRHLPVLVLAAEERRHDLLAPAPPASSRSDARRAETLARRPAARRRQLERPAGTHRARRRGRRDRAQQHRRADRRRGRARSRASARARRRWSGSTRRRFDCIVLDLKLPKASGLRAARARQGRRAPPRRAGDHPHRQGADPPRGDAAASATPSRSSSRTRGSPERLLDETTLACTARRTSLPRRAAAGCSSSCATPTPSLTGRKVLIVDDDVRNVFALTSALETHGMQVALRRERPRGARHARRPTPTVDLVLMDIMMPEIDGYETMRAIRADAGASSGCRSSR